MWIFWNCNKIQNFETKKNMRMFQKQQKIELLITHAINRILFNNLKNIEILNTKKNQIIKVSRNEKFAKFSKKAY